MKEHIRVLVVDRDDRVKRTIAKNMKADSRLTIIDSASSGYEAITKTIRQTPDIVLMNVSIEAKMAGIYACKEINANIPSPKVILYGKDCSDELIFKAFQMGAVNFIDGDYPGAEFVNAVVDAFDGKTSIHYSSAARLIKEFKRILNLQDDLVYVFNVFIKLTPAEINILKHFYNGMRSQEIAKILFIGNATIKTHITNILKKFNLETMIQVVEVLRSTEILSMIYQGTNEI